MEAGYTVDAIMESKEDSSLVADYGFVSQIHFGHTGLCVDADFEMGLEDRWFYPGRTPLDCFYYPWSDTYFVSFLLFDLRILSNYPWLNVDGYYIG